MRARARVNMMKKLAILFFLATAWALFGCGTLRFAELSREDTGADSNTGTEVRVLAKSDVSWDGALLPAYPSGQPEITILRITIPAGQVLAMHKHPVINAGVLLSGELTVRTEDGKTHHLKASEAIVEVVETWHYGKNEGDCPAEIIVFYAGREDIPITIHKP